MKMHKILLSAAIAVSSGALIMAQAPARGGGGGRGTPRPVLSVTTTAFPDGGEIPMENAGRGGNKSPAFEFHWSIGNTPASPPENLQTYAVILHDVENAGRGGTTEDTLHWSAFNIPGSVKVLQGGLPGGDLPDGTRNGPGIMAGRGTPVYFGPGAGAGPFHHYIFEFYALDTKLDLPANTTRADLLKAMDGHIIGKAAYVGRFHAQP
jgi:Raf kinase inhibitor-like YbhB/YbcL family protein